MCGRHVASDRRRFTLGSGRTIAPSMSLQREHKHFTQLYLIALGFKRMLDL